MRISDWSSDVCSSDLPGGADQPAEDAAVAVDQEARRQTLDAHRPRQRHVGIEIEVEPVEAELVEEGFGDARPATVHADGDDGEVLSTEIGLQVVERGHLLDAGRAPGRPEIHQDHLAAEPFQCERRPCAVREARVRRWRSEEHTSELQSLMRISYAVFCLKKKNTKNTNPT